MKACLGLLATLFLLGAQAKPNTQSLTRSGVSEETTLNILRSKVPQGATVTDASCKEIEIGDGNYSYRCTVKWEDK